MILCRNLEGEISGKARWYNWTAIVLHGTACGNGEGGSWFGRGVFL